MFNALKYTQELEKAGFSKQQAEAAVNMVHGFADMNLATKEDVKNVETTLRHELRQEIQGVRHSIETLEYRMTIKLGGIVVVAIGAMAALQKLL